MGTSFFSASGFSSVAGGRLILLQTFPEPKRRIGLLRARTSELLPIIASPIRVSRWKIPSDKNSGFLLKRCSFFTYQDVPHLSRGHSRENIRSTTPPDCIPRFPLLCSPPYYSRANGSSFYFPGNRGKSKKTGDLPVSNPLRLQLDFADPLVYGTAESQTLGRKYWF